MQMEKKMQEIFREIKTNIEFRRRPSLNFSAHIHEDIELVYVKEGSGYGDCNGKRYQLTPGSFFMAFPNQVHRYTDCAPGEYLVLIVKPSALLSYGEVFLEGEPVSALWQGEEEDRHAVFLLETALEEYKEDGDSPIIRAYLTALFGKLLRHYPIEKKRVSGDTVLEILQYCARHYKEDLSVTTIAEELKISRSSVSHIFSLRIGINFCDYINGLRLSDAVFLLKNKSYSITEVAERSGFSTLRTFNRAFRKQYGISPSLYRKNLYRT